jgi:pyrimidine operon attenuation protein/uracil phosphoribosyltransferase
MPSQTNLVAKTHRIGADEIHHALKQVAAAISDRHAATPRLILLGIANGGVEVARRLAALLAPRKVPTGTIDISFHRDDIGGRPIPKEFAPTLIPIDVNGATIILVDDVLFSGRTVKAALDEIFDHGRPAKVELAILVDRGDRKLPFAADYYGFMLEASLAERVKVSLDPRYPSQDAIDVNRTPAPATASA